MNVGGELLESVCDPDAKALCEVRITLANAQYVTFFQGANSLASPLVLNAFVESVQRGLDSSIENSRKHEAGAIRMPAAAELYYTASAAGGSKTVAH